MWILNRFCHTFIHSFDCGLSGTSTESDFFSVKITFIHYYYYYLFFYFYYHYCYQIRQKLSESFQRCVTLPLSCQKLIKKNIVKWQ